MQVTREGLHQEGVQGVAGFQVALLTGALLGAAAQLMGQAWIVDARRSAQCSHFCLQSLTAKLCRQWLQ